MTTCYLCNLWSNTQEILLHRSRESEPDFFNLMHSELFHQQFSPKLDKNSSSTEFIMKLEACDWVSKPGQGSSWHLEPPAHAHAHTHTHTNTHSLACCSSAQLEVDELNKWINTQTHSHVPVWRNPGRSHKKKKVWNLKTTQHKTSSADIKSLTTYVGSKKKKKSFILKGFFMGKNGPLTMRSKLKATGITWLPLSPQPSWTCGPVNPLL